MAKSRARAATVFSPPAGFDVNARRWVDLGDEL